MSRWSRPKNMQEPPPDDTRIEIEGLVALCSLCNEQTDTTFYLPEVKALTWKCVCGHINILEEFNIL